MDLLFTIKLHVSGVNEPDTRQVVEEAMNVACHYLEARRKHDSISYRIREVEEL